MPAQGRLQTLPASEPGEMLADTVGKVAGFSLHAGVAARADERKKPERLCRYISRPAVSEKRLSLTPNGNIRRILDHLDRLAPTTEPDALPEPRAPPQVGLCDTL